MSTVIPTFLGNSIYSLLLFGGKGGVGKTSCTTATAIHLAKTHNSDSFLLVSTDPAHSVADSIASSTPPSNLTIIELNAEKCLKEFKDKYSQQLREIALRGTFLDSGDIDQFLEFSLPGLDELMAFLEISKWVRSGSYKCVVVDTAPTGHTLRLLSMPELMGKWLGALESLLSKYRYMTKLYRGSHQTDATDNFLSELTSLVNYLEVLLSDSTRCCFVPVMLAETVVISETVDLLKQLKDKKIPVQDIIVNRLYFGNQCSICEEGQIRQTKELLLHYGEFSDYTLWGVPIYPEEVRSLEKLETFWNGALRLNQPKGAYSEATVGAGGGTFNSSINNAATQSLISKPLVEEPISLSLMDKPLLLFAGKGGVGKTTLSCTTAVHLARTLKNKKIFLFSTDPAHSLSACIDKEIGPEPTFLSSNLIAMQINAEAEFQALKTQYEQELEQFFISTFSNIEVNFDHEAMRRIMDLSPPGLDEVMALTRIIGFLRDGSFDIFVLDSAPTGHLIRLLELPELIDQWLKAFFGIFLKYKQIFRLPKLTQRLIEISKDLKLLRSLLSNPNRSALFGVSILTEMSFEETKDLIKACQQIGINTPVIFLNLATPATDCSLCSAINQREFLIRKKFQQAFPDKQQPLVYRQADPRQIPQLEKLGEALYSV